MLTSSAVDCKLPDEQRGHMCLKDVRQQEAGCNNVCGQQRAQNKHRLKSMLRERTKKHHIWASAGNKPSPENNSTCRRLCFSSWARFEWLDICIWKMTQHFIMWCAIFMLWLWKPVQVAMCYQKCYVVYEICVCQLEIYGTIVLFNSLSESSSLVHYVAWHNWILATKIQFNKLKKKTTDTICEKNVVHSRENFWLA